LRSNGTGSRPGAIELTLAATASTAAIFGAPVHGAAAVGGRYPRPPADRVADRAAERLAREWLEMSGSQCGRYLRMLRRCASAARMPKDMREEQISTAMSGVELVPEDPPPVLVRRGVSVWPATAVAPKDDWNGVGVAIGG
jgi:hypothetical protein